MIGHGQLQPGRAKRSVRKGLGATARLSCLAVGAKRIDGRIARPKDAQQQLTRLRAECRTDTDFPSPQRDRERQDRTVRNGSQALRNPCGIILNCQGEETDCIPANLGDNRRWPPYQRGRGRQTNQTARA
jgi:hypothetical protein